jgi:hypothetical protein
MVAASNLAVDAPVVEEDERGRKLDGNVVSCCGYV